MTPPVSDYQAAVQALVKYRETFLAEHGISHRRAALSDAGFNSPVDRTELDSAVLSAYIAKFVEQYARLWQADCYLPGLPDDFDVLDFRHLELGGLYIATGALASTGFGLKIDLRGSKISSLTIYQPAGTPAFSVDISDCTLYLASIQRAHVTGDRVTINQVLLETAGSLWLRKSTMINLICRNVSELELDLQDSTIANEFRLQRVTAYQALNLQRTVCTLQASFSGCTFFEPPKVHGAVFPSNTVFIGCRFGGRRQWRWGHRSEHTGEAAENYRVLKMAMKSAGAGLEEMRFFALEMRERRLTRNHRKAWVDSRMSRTDRTVSLLYDLISCYGTSIGRAVFVFALWNCIFLALFLTLGRAGLLSAPEQPVPAPTEAQAAPEQYHVLKAYPAVGYTLQNIINPGAAVSKSGLMPIPNGTVLVLSAIQSLGSLAIIALLLLALRGKFQRGS